MYAGSAPSRAVKECGANGTPQTESPVVIGTHWLRPAHRK
jgi:hypothetical protein